MAEVKTLEEENIDLKEENVKLKKHLNNYRDNEEFGRKVEDFVWLIITGVIYFLAVTVIMHFAIVGMDVVITGPDTDLVVPVVLYLMSSLFLYGIGIAFTVWEFFRIWEDELGRFMHWAIRGVKVVFTRLDEDITNEMTKDTENEDGFAGIDGNALTKKIKGSLKSFGKKPSSSSRPRGYHGEFAKKESK